jgi:hypothetical protein
MISTEQVSKSWSNATTWCSSYGANWHLPSINELKTIYNLKDKINIVLSAAGFTTLGTGYYWSSEEYYSSGNYYAYRFGFSDGNYSSVNCNATYYVRAILAF